MEHDPAEAMTGPSDLVVVGIGASAGGLQAVQAFFDHAPTASGMAFVVILHLSPEHDSNAAALIQGHTAMPVAQVTADLKLAPNHVYVIPPAHQLTLDDGRLLLVASDESHGQRAPIDRFFRALADAYGIRAAAVVLSGSGADGAMGLARVKEHGGVTLVQKPEEAEFSSMPRAAIASGLVDYVRPVAQLPAALVAYWRDGDGPRLPVDALTPVETDADALRDILLLLRTRTGHDFTNYKRPSLFRRIGRRMQVNGLSDLQAYLRALRQRPEEVQALLRDLLISVTNFFRDPPAWAALEAALPQLLATTRGGERVRAWVAGCATGEEAYSLAMLLAEHATRLPAPLAIQIFASDIDEQAIARARQGRYPDTIAADVSAERLERFFTTELGHYRIKQEIRDLVLFAPHNLLRDPPFSRLDLVSCRNVLIYLNRAMQEQVLQLFHFVLQPNGLLLLGSSESTDSVPSLFQPIDKAQRLFQHRATPSAIAPLMPSVPLVGPQQERGETRRASGDPLPSFADLDQQALAQYGPPAVIVNAEYEVVHVARGAGRFLRFGDGEVSSNLLKLVHPDLRLELRSALFTARKHAEPVATRRLRVEIDGTARLLSVRVQPLVEPLWAQGYILVAFDDVADTSEEAPHHALDTEPLVRQLEDELHRTREQLRVTIEQYETVVEEHKAANEELQAINEELRAATEELETSKEELQSLNEELHTVNQELKHKVEEVSQTSSDVQNLMAATEIGTIFLDRQLRIRRYTPAAQTLFNLIPSDVGRPLAHITHLLANDQFSVDAQRVLDTLIPIEHSVVSTAGRTYLARLLPYRTVEDKIDGVSLSFVDITARTLAENVLRVSEERLRALIESATDYAILTMTPAGIVDSWSVGAERLFGYTERDIIGQPDALLFTPEDRVGGVPEQARQTALADGRAADERFQLRKDGARVYVSGVLTPLRAGELRGFVKIARDLTARQQADEQLRVAQDVLEQRVVERTGELARANTILQRGIAERSRLTRQLVGAQEDERHRISRELHDQLGQSLSALRLGLSTLADQAQAPPDTVARLQGIAAQLDADVERMALELRPSALDDLGLVAALRQLADAWTAQMGTVIDLQLSGLGGDRLPSEVEVVVYRVAQEALTNVFKHARAAHVSVLLERRSDQVQLIVEDDGRGFDLDEPALEDVRLEQLGLLGMQERAAFIGGSVTIESAPGRGTSVFLRAPLGRSDTEEAKNG
jgi:two-component system, chemotaxis family, CheB/CheR fusion protein